MAVWQFDLYIIFSDALNTMPGSQNGEGPPLPIELVYEFQEELVHYLGTPWLMLSDWLVFGPENGNRVDVVFDSDKDARVSVRCDVREEAPQFLVLATDLARFHGCQFFSPLTREVIEPDLELVLNAIRRSQA